MMGFQSGINAALGSIAGAAFGIKKTLKDIPEERGQIRAQQKAVKQTKQKRNFMDYLKNLESNLGGKVGDLPRDLQNVIAKQYSKSQRQKIMNQMDKGDKK